LIREVHPLLHSRRAILSVVIFLYPRAGNRFFELRAHEPCVRAKPAW